MRKKIKSVLFLTPRKSDKYLGGVEKHVKILKVELKRKGYKVKELSLDEVGTPAVRLPLPWSTSTRRGVATAGFGRTSGFLTDKNPGSSEKMREKGIRVGELALTDIASLDPSPGLRMTDENFRMTKNSRTAKTQAWKYLWENRKLILSSDIIHVHDIFWWYSPFRFLFFWKPVFVTFHGWEGVYPPSKSAVFQKKLANVLCRGSIGVGKYLEKWYGVKTNFITYGVFDSQNLLRTVLSGRGQSSRSTKNDAASIVFLGRLEEVNGVGVVLQTANLLRSDLSGRDQTSQTQIDCHVVPLSGTPRNDEYIFVGDGSYRKKCEKYGIVTGMVKNVNQYLEKADVVIASSYLSIMEAMAMGKPVIAIANNPLKLDYLKSHPMARKIEIVRTAEELANLLRTVLPGIPSKFKGQSSIAREWAREQTSEKLADIYESLWRVK